jgi:hypothetical protein
MNKGRKEGMVYRGRKEGREEGRNEGGINKDR